MPPRLIPLDELQRTLCAVYDTPLTVPVGEFVCDEEEAFALSHDAGSVDRGELLLVAEHDGDVSLSLYVREEALALLSKRAPNPSEMHRFAAHCLALEGVSHFAYVVFRAENAQSVSQLELELQAEVDKYVATLWSLTDWPVGRPERLLEGQGARLVRQREFLSLSRRLRVRLYDEVSFLDDAHSEHGERYRIANRLAARYTSRLEQKFMLEGFAGMVREARRFYRLGAREKLEVSRG